MGRFVVGDIVAVPFPFSDLTGRKLRPALVLAGAEHDDLILCQITSNAYASKKSIVIISSDFAEGDLPVKSYARPDKLFTAEETIIQKWRGHLKSNRCNAILEAVREQFKDI